MLYYSGFPLKNQQTPVISCYSSLNVSNIQFLIICIYLHKLSRKLIITNKLNSDYLVLNLRQPPLNSLQMKGLSEFQINSPSLVTCYLTARGLFLQNNLMRGKVIPTKPKQYFFFPTISSEIKWTPGLTKHLNSFSICPEM